ncbi:L-aspartate oxidase [Halomonas sp. Bachu 37]|uniref:L-aspartate oxidase n=1 Tax=Halomonas kashgarensis TaxID=3084920 RepID=UPI003216609F
MATRNVLIIGGGVAGLTLALEIAATRPVILVRPARDVQGASRWAQGGIAAVLSPDDAIEAHIQDTLVAGDGLCDEAAVRFTVENGPAAIEWLIDQGVPFTLDPDPQARYPYHLTREGGHGARRIIHAEDATGRAVVDTLLNAVQRHANISQRSDLTVVRLLQDGRHHCRGAYCLDEAGQGHELLADDTVLATGGASGLYLHTTTPAPGSGEGMIMAAELGATLMNLEFQQFHPTCLYDPEGPAFLISEAVRGEGGHLLNEKGERFMLEADSRGELAPRDIVARAIDSQIHGSQLDHVWLDIRHLGAEAIHHHFPTIQAHCASRGIDIVTQPIPVVPAAHYSCGGIATDLDGASRVAHLFAIGEAACTGLHGANRMASNSLLECLVFARSCAAALENALPPPAAAIQPKAVPWPADGPLVSTTELHEVRREMRQLMSRQVSIVRSTEGLHSALIALEALQESLLQKRPSIEAQTTYYHIHQALQLACLTVTCAQQRRESRGLHYNTDFPSGANSTSDTRQAARPSIISLA